MKLEDYSKYYIQDSDHYLIPKYDFVGLFNEMENWKDECKQLKETLKSIEEYIKKPYFEEVIPCNQIDILDIIHKGDEK